MWLWLLWKYGKTKYFKADENKFTDSVTNVAGFPHLGIKQAAVTAQRSWVAPVLSVSNTGLLLLVN